MDIEMRLTSKGQVTIPKILRDALGIKPRGKVIMAASGNQLVLRSSSSKKRSKDPFSKLIGSATSGLTTDEIMRMTRGDE